MKSSDRRQKTKGSELNDRKQFRSLICSELLSERSFVLLLSFPNIWTCHIFKGSISYLLSQSTKQRSAFETSNDVLQILRISLLCVTLL